MQAKNTHNEDCIRVGSGIVMRKKLKGIFNKKGETLVEVLVSMLIVLLASALIAGAITTSNKLNNRAESVNKEYLQYLDDLAVAGTKDSLGDGTITIRNYQTIDITYTGNSRSFWFDVK